MVPGSETSWSFTRSVSLTASGTEKNCPTTAKVAGSTPRLVLQFVRCIGSEWAEQAVRATEHRFCRGA